ncbi:MAG: DUF3365 domain-containing protein, partial [Alphaproteobacteria bacterium]|nr:DUF3365 domain-containing protein [Alphaproteobacteria bacterium]
MNFWRKSLVWQLLLPVPLLVVMLVAGWVVLPGVIKDNVVSAAIDSAQQTVSQFKTLRAYYTNNIIKKVVADGNLRPSFNHKQETDGVPLPATLIHDLSQLLAEQDTKVRLYSNFPFPNRSSRKLDDFQRDAWSFLSENPNETFVREVEEDGQRRVRVALADRMVAQVCVDCHNSHPTSPKTDWRLGDIRGVLEVDSVIEAQLAAGGSLTNGVLLTGFTAAILLAGLITIIARRQVGPMRQMAASVGALTRGEKAELQTERLDEIGQLARSMETFYFKGLEAARLRSALDGCETMIMVGNRKFEIAYVNPSLEAFLREHQTELKKDLPWLDVSSLIKSSIDGVLEILNHSRATIQTQSGADRIEIEIGGRSLRLAVSPVHNQNGEFIGTVIEWQDTTAERAVQEQIERVITAVNQGDFSMRVDVSQATGGAAGLAEGVNQLANVIERAMDDFGRMF